MYYVVLETDTEHFSENPKDQTRITQFYYQFIDSNSLDCSFNEGENCISNSIKVCYDESDGLQKSVQQLDTIINDSLKDSTFVICSLFSTWTLRVILQRQAYDENVTLPTYLKELKVFDIWKEYGKWSEITNNESKSEDLDQDKQEPFPIYTSDTQGIRLLELLRNLKLSDIYKDKLKQVEESTEIPDPTAITDDIDTTEISVPISVGSKRKNKNDMMQKSERLLSSLRNITTTITVLLQLCKQIKSNELLTNKVLKYPYDSQLDLQTFKKENSCILYMSNLPIDTTQSELESWFTQYGTRPVGFWTFRNILDDIPNNLNIWRLNIYSYVEELTSISGFVVFQNHDCASEALSLLNGRSMLSNVANTKQPRVVEHIIELQPSSTSVIDSAQDILCPFPQSKNKPRPGDWHCPSCGFLNFQRRTACFRCSFPIPIISQKGKQDNFINNNIGVDTFDNGSESFNNNTYRNNNTNSEQPQNILSPTISNNSNTNTQIHDSNNIYGNNSNMKHNMPYRHNNNNNNNIPFRAGDWKCTVCDYHNFAKNVVCLRCGGPKSSNTQSRNGNTNKIPTTNSKNSYNLNHVNNTDSNKNTSK